MNNPIKIFAVTALLAFVTLLMGCGGGGGGSASVNDIGVDSTEGSDASDDTEETTSDEPGATDSPWIINTTERSMQIFESGNSNTGVLEDVQLVDELTVDSVNYVYVEATGIPNYDIEMTQTIIDELNSRPRASSDFGAGVSSANVGDTVEFGQDIGYNSSTENCGTTGGSGYWPPGPGCPIDVGKAEYFAASPSPATTDCATGLGTTGLMVNGTSIFNWGDGMSYGNNVWYNLAPVAEQYDVDICGGHAAQGEYHHHFYTSCLADLVADDGTVHSPIYGFAADGYPVYGPWENTDTLALSGWKTRDYGTAFAEGGCNTPGERTCTLVNEYDVGQGVSTTVGQGPDIGETVTTLSGNTLPADDGYYYEDYYYAQASASGAQLDQHNGHDNDDGRGYHYHITLSQDENGKLIPAFPYTIGPGFYGELPENAAASCGGVAAGGGMPPSVDTQTGFVEGHAHLYVNGVKVQRLYGNYVHLPASLLRAGINQITVTINNHGHMYWAVDGRQILATVFIKQGIEEPVVYRFESSPALG